MKPGGRLVLASCAVALSARQNAVAQIPRDARALVVHITYAGLPDQVEAYGAGIIIGATATDLVVATAAHVVLPGEAGLRVLLPFSPRDSLTARIARASEKRDIAILLVRKPRTGRATEDIGFNRRASGTVTRGEQVTPIGCPANSCAQIPNSERAVGVHEGNIVFESFIVSPGNSGGALFNEQWEVAGLVTEKGDPFGRAIPIGEVIDSALAWGYHPSLRTRRIPRAPYPWRVGVTWLQAINSHADSFPPNQRFSGSVTLLRQVRPWLAWHASYLSLRPDNLNVQGGVVGGRLLGGDGRLNGQVFLEGGLGRVEGRYLRDSYLIACGSGNCRVPVWQQVKQDGVVVGGGLDLEIALAPHIALQLTSGYWNFTVPDSLRTRPLFFAGGGLRLGGSW